MFLAGTWRLSCSVSERGRVGSRRWTECERAGGETVGGCSLYSCEYRFGYSLPLGRPQQANYQASVTEGERQKRRLTEANNTFQPHRWLQLQLHPVIHLPHNLTAPGPLLLSISHFSASLQAPWFHKRLQAMSAAPEREEEKGWKRSLNNPI